MIGVVKRFMNCCDSLKESLKHYQIDLNEYIDIIKDLYESEKVQKMGEFPHHGEVNCLDHSLRVSIYSYRICKRLKLNAHEVARGALLHDLFLYDWSKVKLEEGLHGMIHPKIALKNAEELVTLTKVEKDIIEKHMFPLTIKPPKYFESLIVCLVDKYVASIELLGWV